MDEFIEGIKHLFLQYIYFSLYGIIGVLLLTGILPTLISVVTSPFIWLKRKIFGE